MPTPTHRNTPRVPRAYLDPVDNPADALAIIALAMAEPVSYTHLTLPTNREV